MELTPKIRIELSQRSDDDLLEELRSLIQTTAEHVARLAHVWHELERRGHDLSSLRAGIGRYLSAVALGRLSPRAVVSLAGNSTAIRALTHLPVSEQERLLDAGSISVTRRDGTVDVQITELTAADVARAFDPVSGRLLTPEQQRQPRQNKTRTRPSRRVIIDLTHEQHERLQAEAARVKKSAAGLVIQCLANERVI
ncbi:MAG: hypothetical protein NW217_13355 [Hyphomicrobiaceae bacterium]|nr:hypothetical protein [Hyphomicrobiaceae bacterium]